MNGDGGEERIGKKVWDSLLYHFFLRYVNKNCLGLIVVRVILGD